MPLESIICTVEDVLGKDVRYKTMTGKSTVDHSIWFERVNRCGVLTRQVADFLNVKIVTTRLDLRKKKTVKNFSNVSVSEKLHCSLE